MTENQQNILQAYQDEVECLEHSILKMKEKLVNNKATMKECPNLKTLGRLVSCHLKIQVALDSLDSI